MIIGLHEIKSARPPNSARGDWMNNAVTDYDASGAITVKLRLDQRYLRAALFGDRSEKHTGGFHDSDGEVSVRINVPAEWLPVV